MLMRNAKDVSVMSVSTFRNYFLKLSSLQQRALTACLIVPAFLIALYSGGMLFTILLSALILRSYHEWIRLSYKTMVHVWPPKLEYAAYATLAATICMADFITYGWSIVVLIVGTIITTIIGHFYLERGPKEAPGFASFGVLYLGIAALSLVWLRQEGEMLSPEPDWGPLATLIVQIWATDTFAYFVGRKVGGPKVAPRISPNKTWSGLMGGAVASSLMMGGMAYGLDFIHAKPWFFVIGFVLALVAQAGDFFESYVKRRAGFKDSGSILPGHGGLLDRIDGLIAAAPVFMIILYVIKDS